MLIKVLKEVNVNTTEGIYVLMPGFLELSEDLVLEILAQEVEGIEIPESEDKIIPESEEIQKS